MKENSILLVLPVPLAHSPEGLMLESQACNGVRLWLTNFDHVTLACPARDGPSPDMHWSPLASVPGFERLTVVTLPVAANVSTFARTLIRAARQIGRAIDSNQYLQFAISGLIGDWASVAAVIAFRKGRRYAIWTDVIGSEEIAAVRDRSNGLQHAKMTLLTKATVWYERWIIRRAALGLFHGMDTFTEYAPFCGNSSVAHDVHLDEGDRINKKDLSLRHDGHSHRTHSVYLGPEARIVRSEIEKRPRSGASPLHIIYAGRVEPHKGPDHWIEALKIAKKSGASFHATWFGQGSELAASRELVKVADLDDVVSFYGNLSDRARLIFELKNSDFFLFCHRSKESPRCLVEALMCGLPIVGYHSSYAADLIEKYGGGILTKPESPADLAKQIVRLANDKDLLKTLAYAAWSDSLRFDDRSVFRHRSDLIKAHI